MSPLKLVGGRSIGTFKPLNHMSFELPCYGRGSGNRCVNANSKKEYPEDADDDNDGLDVEFPFEEVF